MKTITYSLLLGWGFFFAFVTPTLAQTYIPYYHQLHIALEAQYKGDCALARTEFEQAFSMVPYVRTRNYEKATACALKLKDYPTAYKWIKQAILQGASPKFWKPGAPKDFLQSPYYSQLTDSIPIWEIAEKSRLNPPYIALIDSLFYLDQRIGRKARGLRGNYDIDKDALPASLNELDAIIWDTLLAAIDRWGFPSEEALGPKGYDKADIILLHNGRMEENTADLPMLKAAVLAGEYPPDDYAIMFDQRVMFMGQKPHFYVLGWKGPDSLTEEEVVEIDKRRAELGIRPRSAYEITIRKRRSTSRLIW